MASHALWRAEESSLDALEQGELSTYFPLGTLHEFYASTLNNSFTVHVPTALPLAVLRTSLSATKSKKRIIVFIGRECYPSPFYLRDCFASPFEDFIFIDAKTSKEKQWAVETALSSKSVAGIFASLDRLTFSSSRRLTLLAKKNGPLCFLFRDIGSSCISSASYARWKLEGMESVHGQTAWQLELLHTKGAKPLKTTWRVGLTHGEKVSLYTFPELVDQSDSDTAHARENTWRSVSNG